MSDENSPPSFENKQEAMEFVADHTFLAGSDAPLSELYPQI